MCCVIFMHVSGLHTDFKLFHETVFPFKLKSQSSSMTDKSNVNLNACDPFPMMSPWYLVLYMKNTSLDNLRCVHHMDGASAYYNIDETSPSDVSSQTNKAHVSPFDEMFPNSSTLTDECGPINSSPYGDQSTRFRS